MSNNSKKDNKSIGCIINASNASGEPGVCLNITCVADLITHIREKK